MRREKHRASRALHKTPLAITIISLGLLLSTCAPKVVNHNNAGNERFAEGAYDEAIAEYRQAQLDEPDRSEPYYNAANAYNRQAQLETTLAQAQQALRTADADLVAKIWYNLGNAFFDAESWPEAIAAYQEALRAHPDDPDAKHNLELALQKLKEQQQQEQQPKTDDQSQSGESTPTAASQSENSAKQDQATPEPPDAAQEAEGLTPEQARQLLQAMVGDNETLQERLQEIYPAPGPPPARDW